MGADWAISVATPSAADRSSASGTNRSTRPMRAPPPRRCAGRCRTAAPPVARPRRAAASPSCRSRGVEAEPVEIGGKARLGRGHAEIGNQRQAQAAAHRRTLHRRDNGRFAAEQPHRLLVRWPPSRSPTVSSAGRLKLAPAQKFLPSAQSRMLRISGSASNASNRRRQLAESAPCRRNYWARGKSRRCRLGPRDRYGRRSSQAKPPCYDASQNFACAAP